MARVEHVRDVLSGPLTSDYLKEKTEAGWKLVAVEWQRQLQAEDREPSGLREEVPFGLRVGDDCRHLEENPIEKQTLMFMMDLIVQDSHLFKVAEELNRRGFRTRDGTKWTQRSVFNMLPRLIEVGPQIVSSEEWEARRQRLAKLF